MYDKTQKEISVQDEKLSSLKDKLEQAEKNKEDAGRSRSSKTKITEEIFEI